MNFKKQLYQKNKNTIRYMPWMKTLILWVEPDGRDVNKPKMIWNQTSEQLLFGYLILNPCNVVVSVHTNINGKCLYAESKNGLPQQPPHWTYYRLLQNYFVLFCIILPHTNSLNVVCNQNKTRQVVCPDMKNTNLLKKYVQKFLCPLWSSLWIAIISWAS